MFRLYLRSNKFNYCWNLCCESNLGIVIMVYVIVIVHSKSCVKYDLDNFPIHILYIAKYTAVFDYKFPRYVLN